MSETPALAILDSATCSLKNNAALRDTPKGERSAARAAAILTAWTGQKHVEEDVWRTLLAVKMAREIQGQFHQDDYVDMAGYSSLLGESLDKKAAESRAAVELHAQHTLLAKKCLEEARAHVRATRAPTPGYDPDEVKFQPGDVPAPKGRTAHYWGSMEQAADVEGLL